MAFSARVEELDREIRSTVARALTELREELAARLRRSTDELVLHIEELEPTLPAELLPLSELAPLAEQEAATARRAAFAELRDGLAALDRARSQADVLSALLEGVGRYASRALLLLTRPGELRGWGAYGFGDEAAGVALPLPGDGPWAALAAGRGTVPLGASQCAELCSRLESELPREGVLVPLVLRDRVAAALYADRTGGDELLLEPLQALVYAAAQAIESLPFRERGSTPTLHLAEAGDGGAAAPALALWGEEAPSAPAAPAEAAAAVAEPEAPPAVEGMIAAEVEPSVPETILEPPAETAAAETAEEPWEGEPAVASTEAESVPAGTGAWPVEPAPESAAEAAPVWGAPVEEEDTAGMAPAALDDTAAILGSPVEEVSGAGWRLEDEGLAAEPEAATLALERDDTAAEGPAGTSATLEEPTVAAAPEAAEPETTPVGAAPWAAEPPPHPQETVMLRSPLTEPVPSPYAEAPAFGPAAAAPAPPVRIAAVGSEVQPPSGVQGPGWAFSGSRAPTSGEEAQHEEARRLARLLVSEIKLYNEEQVEEGRRNRDLYERLKEDIDRSRQMYEERVDANVLNTTDYFYQELVRILAAGDSRALGI
ncbi:MAG TPA: hypothetical protein VF121_07075 [Thermoanaerobaculia bacterium]|nr:hypothetical protein [Thermoanaerobaculia bacterium]